MTTIEAAVAAARAKRCVLAAAIISAALAGCSAGSDFSVGNSQIAAPQAAAQSAATSGPRVAIAAPIGPPQTVTDQLTKSLTEALEQQKVAVAKSPSDKADYTLRGYLVAAKDKAGTKFSYIWDVTDPAGKRVNRITGEDLAPGAAGADPWAALTPQLLQSVSTKTASSIGAWLPTQATASVAANTPSGVGAGATAAPQGVTAGPPAVTKVAAAGAAPAPVAASGPVTGGPIAVVQRVAGAPGDGSDALTGAIQRELTKSGVSVSEQAAASPNAYRVEGRVKLGDSRDGKQAIQIDWDVKDAQGRKLGTVSQKNEVPKGSLDGAWGQTADAAAAAAAQGILKLMPAQKATN